MDVGSFVWSVPPRAFQPYCPACKIIANEYYEKNEQNALILTPKVAFQQFRELAAKDKEIEGLKSGFAQIIWEVKAGATDVEVLAICRKMLFHMHKGPELSFSLLLAPN
jgi:hypothetical protein